MTATSEMKLVKFNGKEYFRFAQRYDFTEAVDLCNKYGAKIVEPKTTEETSFLVSHQFYDNWVNAYYSESNDRWQWASDDSPVGTDRFQWGEEKCADCVYMRLIHRLKSDKLTSFNMDEKFSVVCEKPIP